MLKYDPFPLIFQGADTIKLACLEFFDLADSPQAKECLLKLIRQQLADGAFPSHLDPKKWGMDETVRNTLLMLKVGLPPEGVNVHSAVHFILSHQRPDGGWSENRALELPPERTWLSNRQSITWLTADVVVLLSQVGMGEGTECTAAVEWLRTMQSQQGGWPSLARDAGDQQNDAGDPDVTAQITFLMGELFGQDDPAYLKGKKLFEGYLDECARDVARGYRIRWRDGEKEELDVYTLAHLLLSWWLDPLCRLQRGYDVSDARVKRMMEALVDIQRQDGGWRPFFAQESSPVYTFMALKALILSGALARSDLKVDVRAYAV